MPYAFTEQGVAMLAGNRDLTERLTELERQVDSHDASICSLFDAIRQLMSNPKPSGRPIGFTADLEGGGKGRT